MAKFQCIEFTRSWQDNTCDIHSEMGSRVRLTDLVPFCCEAPSRTRVAFDTAFVKKPKVNTLTTQPFPDQFNEGFSLFLVLAVWPRTRNFQPKSFIMKPPH